MLGVPAVEWGGHLRGFGCRFEEDGMRTILRLVFSLIITVFFWSLALRSCCCTCRGSERHWANAVYKPKGLFSCAEHGFSSLPPSSAFVLAASKENRVSIENKA